MGEAKRKRQERAVWPLLDHLGVGLFDEFSDPSERFAPPITQRLDSRIDPLRGRVSSFSSFETLLLVFMAM